MTMVTGNYAYSLDRMDPTKGYTKDNVCLCCWIVNHMKKNLAVDEFKSICVAVAQQ